MPGRPCGKIEEGPIRTCAGCRSRRPQSQLIRVVRSGAGAVRVDLGPRGRSGGRGAYVCRQMRCVERALKGRLRKALKQEAALPEALERELLAEVQQR